MASRGRKYSAVCPVCEAGFLRRKDGTPHTCSRSCARVLDVRRRGTTANWKGGRSADRHGYIRVWMPHHPQAGSNGYILEHRVVMERVIGRPLYPYEKVHHRNGNRADNRPENLELWVHRQQPTGARVEDLIREMVVHHPELTAQLLAEAREKEQT